jgi:hypothetical protein
MSAGFIGLGGKVTDSEVGAVAIDAVALILVAGVSYHFIVKPSIEWIGDKMKKDDDKKDEPKTETKEEKKARLLKEAEALG